MTWHTYGTFCLFAVLLTLAPGPDFAVVLKNALSGRLRGMAAMSGITVSNVVQGTAAALGLGALILRSQVLFEVVRWAGVAYLTYLGVQTLRAAWRRRRREAADEGADEDAAGRPDTRAGPGRRGIVVAGFRQGFLSNITNAKVIAFYLSVLPQFVQPGSDTALQGLLLAYTLVVISIAWLALVVVVVGRVKAWVARPRVRRALDTVTGTLLLGFGVGLAAEGH
jgi:threonine/homoserine/homoserine lactone efflux protein